MSSDLLWRYEVTVRLGFTEYLAANPPLIVATTTLPRAVLQCLFFTLLGSTTSASGEQFAFVGSVAVIITLSTLVGVCDVPMLEKWSGTFYRLQNAPLRPGTIFLLRTFPWLVEAVLGVLLCIAVVGPVTGQASTSWALLGQLPIYLLMTVTSALAGLTAAALAVGRRADVLVGNAFAYLVMVAGGALIPVGQLRWLDAVGRVLPIRNGLLAVRDRLAGRSGTGHLLAEVLVGAVWGCLAFAAYSIQTRRARREGIDDYA